LLILLPPSSIPFPYTTLFRSKLASPAMEIDHLRNAFDGGRWVFLSAELDQQFVNSNEATALIRTLAERARHGSEEFTARPALPLDRKSTRLNSSHVSISYAVF